MAVLDLQESEGYKAYLEIKGTIVNFENLLDLAKKVNEQCVSIEACDCFPMESSEDEKALITHYKELTEPFLGL